VAFIGLGGGEKGAPEVVGGGTPTTTIKAQWSFGGWPLRKGEEGEGAGWRRVGAWHTRGEGEDAWGRGRGARKAVAGAAKGGWGRREVGEAPDRRAPPVGERVREGEVEWAGGGCWVEIGSCGPAAGKKRKGGWGGLLSWKEG
jgi:hypothetical protein